MGEAEPGVAVGVEGLGVLLGVGIGVLVGVGDGVRVGVAVGGKRLNKIGRYTCVVAASSRWANMGEFGSSAVRQIKIPAAKNANWVLVFMGVMLDNDEM